MADVGERAQDRGRHRSHVERIELRGWLGKHLRKRRHVRRDDRAPAGGRLQHRQPETLFCGGHDRQLRDLMQRDQLGVGDAAGEQHVVGDACRLRPLVPLLVQCAVAAAHDEQSMRPTDGSRQPTPRHQ